MPEHPKLTLRLRLYHDSEIAFGPGKATLLEQIQQTGSISQAAKQLNMSYRRAWLLVNTMNQCFIEPLVITQTGGTHGGGAHVSALGLQVLSLFRSMEQAARHAMTPQHLKLAGLMVNPQPTNNV